MSEAFRVGWAVLKSDPYFCEICGKEADDFIDLDGNMIICMDCYDPAVHEESTLVDFDGNVIHSPYDFSDKEKEKLRSEYQ